MMLFFELLDLFMDCTHIDRLYRFFFGGLISGRLVDNSAQRDDLICGQSTKIERMLDRCLLLPQITCE